MDTDELRAACEAAGLKRTQWKIGKGSHEFVCRGWTDGAWRLMHDHPALVAWVASLLVARVRHNPAGHDIAGQEYADALARETSDTVEDMICATDEQRIRAAMAVLEGEG